MRRHCITRWLLSVAAVCVACPAMPFENQWHLGAGLGVAAYDRVKGVAPAVGLHGAYGMSDSFDARLELTNAWHASHALSSALLFVTYKLDVIQLIPWGGIGFGGYYLGDALSGQGRAKLEPGMAALFGLDYAWSREWGLSLAIGAHFMPLADDRSAMALRTTTALLRLEHRWGW